MEKEITPISYIHGSSMLLNYLNSAYNEIVSINTGHGIPHLNKKQTNFITAPTYKIEENLISLLPYLKSYKGPKWDKTKREFDKEAQEVVFYDEREWRYIPNIEDDNLELFLPKNDYDDSSKLEEKNEQLKSKKLSFSHSDINFIIVSNDDDIPEMVDKIEEIMTDKYSLSDREIKILITKIISMRQIRENF